MAKSPVSRSRSRKALQRRSRSLRSRLVQLVLRQEEGFFEQFVADLETARRGNSQNPGGRAPAQGLTHSERLFVESYVASGNATRAYTVAHPGCSTTTAGPAGHRLARKCNVREAIAEGRRRRLEALEMSADEAMRRMAIVGRADVRQLFDEDGNLLPVGDWPDEIALAVDRFEERRSGRKVCLGSRLKALEFIVKTAPDQGKGRSEPDLAALIARHARPEDRAMLD